MIKDFCTHFLLFAIGDVCLYYFTNTLYNRLFPPKARRTQIELLSLREWIQGNTISYGLLYFVYSERIGLLYFNANDYGVVYTLVSPILYFYAQDALFYAMHRLAHIDILYKYIHFQHHKYRRPTTWVSRISNWVDSNLENIAFIAPALFIPMNIYVWFTCLIFTYLWANFLHDSSHKIVLTNLNDNTDHSLHHYYGKHNYNFGFYFNHCDKFFGTYKKYKLDTDIV